MGSEDNMPRTVEATRFKMVVLKAQSLRTQMAKISENFEGYIEEIKELEAEDNTEESEYFLKRWDDANREFKKVEEIKAEHEGLVTKIRLMCGFMMSTGHEDGAVATKVKGDAKEALDNIEKAEKEVDTKVRQFRKTNRKYLMGKKKKPTTQVTEGQARAPAPVANSQWILQMATKMEPEGTLKNDSRLTEMRAWKKQWIQYTSYLRNQNFPLDDKLYAEMLVNKCDVSMKLPLEAMEDLYKMGEDLLWEKIENIYKESNPVFLRRVKCYESKIMKGELLSEFATRLKLEYKESEVSKTTIWGHFEYKLLAGLDTAGSDNRELKSKLVEEIKKKPDPTERDLDAFLQIVRDHESMIC